MTSALPFTARSWLFPPADSERKMTKAADGDADIVLLDLAVSLVEALQQSEEGNFAIIPVDFLQVVDELGVGLEVPRNQRRVDVNSLSLTGVDNPV